MTRVAQPRELAEIKGLVAHNPQRYRTKPVKHRGPFGQPPKHLTGKVLETWLELEDLVPGPILTKAERIAMEAFANLVAEYREDPRKFTAAKHSTLISYLSRFGMTPSDRQRIPVPTEPEADPVDEFLQ